MKQSATKSLRRGWHLLNGEEMNRQHPESFLIPTESERRGVVAGNLVKVAARSRDGGERFWVIVLATVQTPEAFAILGEVNNDTFERHGLRFGDVIRFGPENVINIWTQKASQ